MKNTSKYSRQFFPAPAGEMKWTKKNYIDKAPKWCSVDLRDGNQSLIIPMSLEEKLEFFNLLVKVGFKEIEVGFPAASETEYTFLRTLIEQNLIPDDVTVQVLTQSREHIIRKTFEALRGCKNAIVHLYNSTSLAQREQVFRKSKDEIKAIAIEGAKLFNKIEKETGEKFRYEYSPESFTGTEPEFALEVCNAVLDIWKPTPERKAIINLPVTVELSMPHVYANQVEYMCDNLKYRDCVEVSLHPHNDRGCAVADSELGLLAGADRIEGTLFGNGERTGNVDIVTLALNMFSQGIDPKLDFTNLPAITEVYEKVTRMRVYERQPYSGQLVFAAFSGSHQDAIAKGMKFREGKNIEWTVPYLPIDPTDIGRVYEADVIRINSQSGKGGIGYIMETQFNLNLPPKLREHFGYHIKSISDREHRELMPSEVYDIFMRDYVNITSKVDVVKTSFSEIGDGNLEGTVNIEYDGKSIGVVSIGNGRLDCVSSAIKSAVGKDYTLQTYTQHAIEGKTSAKAAAYVGITYLGKTYWGAGIDSDIGTSSIKALVSAVNSMLCNPKEI